MRVLRLKEPASALTHLVGALLSVAGLILLVDRAMTRSDSLYLVSAIVFGSSLILLYTASTLYHAIPVSPATERIFRKVDHMMIFILIAGSYTPFCLIPLRGVWGWSLLIGIWGCALLGIMVKLFWMNAPRWLSTGFYLLMGWLALVAIYPLAQALSTMELRWMFAGGLFYTVGAVLYATKWPNPWPGKFGFHEIWHLFVMAGSAAHFLAVLGLL